MTISIDNITLVSATQDQFDRALNLTRSVLREGYPMLDLRAGTVLRSLLLEPAASLSAVNVDRSEKLASVLALSDLAAIQNPSALELEAASALLSNFNVTYQAGTRSAGRIVVRVEESSDYYIPSGFSFTTDEGVLFSTTSAYRAAPDVDEINDVSVTVIPLSVHGSGGYFFVVPVEADADGASGNIAKGTALTPTSTLYGFTSAYAEAQFSGGSSEESIADAVARIPEALSSRGFTSRASIAAQLTDQFSESAHRVAAVSVQGYGDPAQVRDKHNALGVSVGGRADVFVRTGYGLPVSVLTKTGVYGSDGKHTITLTVAESSGVYAVKSVVDVGGDADMGSYAFEETRVYSDDAAQSGHDFDPDSASESAFTAYQGITISVSGAGIGDKQFRVELYAFPGISSIQSYIDSSEVRNVFADIVVRGAPICLVSVVAKVRYDRTKSQPDLIGMRDAVVEYVNSKSFVRRLTRSELSNIMIEGGAGSADLGAIAGMDLRGRVMGADLVWRTVSGDSLEIAAIADGPAMIDRGTVVFATSPDMVHIEGVAE